MKNTDRHMLQRRFTLLPMLVFLFPLFGFSQNVVLNFSGMTPHVGQKLEARLVDKRNLREVSRVTLATITDAAFSLTLKGEKGEDYFIEFYADHNKNGRYDAPPADHAWRLEKNDLADGDNAVAFTHNTTFTNIAWRQMLTVNFTGMAPHVDQQLEARVFSLNDRKEAGRVTLDKIPGAAFKLELPFLEPGKNYWLEFYADLNKNNRYDAPPTDHAWRIALATVQGDVAVDFSHNTSFTNIDWTGLFKLELKNMSPHLGQLLEVRLRDRRNNREVSRFRRNIDVTEMDVYLPGLRDGGNFWVDFYADHNKNGVYDNPPADHAWRLPVTDIEGDEDTTFLHNTSFTQIDWRHQIMLQFSSMAPHLNQRLEVRVRDINYTGKEVGRVVLDSITQTAFVVCLPFGEVGHSYFLDFFADHNKNGSYNAPPTDHAWRLTLMNVAGDTTTSFVHNTAFTDIGASGLLTVNFTGMTPHLNQQLELRVVDQGNGTEIGRVKQIIPSSTFQISVPGLQAGRNYQVDFYSDHNKNGRYDAPPTDHAWRLTFTAPAGDHSLNFAHNTTFTNVDWVYLFTLRATNMTPHLTQRFELRLINANTKAEASRFVWPEILVPNFWVCVPGLRIGEKYNADFYADHNKNGVYDAPPADHAWRLTFDDNSGDTTLTFQHNTSFTNIEFATAVEEISGLGSVQVFPNPVRDEISLQLQLDRSMPLRIDLFNSAGQAVRTCFNEQVTAGENLLRFGGMEQLQPGLYFLRLQDAERGGVRTIGVTKQ